MTKSERRELKAAVLAYTDDELSDLVKAAIHTLEEMGFDVASLALAEFSERYRSLLARRTALSAFFERW